MSLNVIDLIKGQLGPALISQAATKYGESESGISKAISGLLPIVLGGMANNASNPSVLDAISTSNSSGMLNNLLGSTENSSVISTVLSAIFGDKIGGLVNTVSSFAGVNSTTVQSLLGMVTGATAGSVGKYATDNNLDKSGISSLLEDQKGIVSTLMPAGLSLASLGLGNMFGSSTSHVENVTVSTPTEPKVEVNRGGATHVNVDNEPNGNGSIWKWLLPLLLALAIAIFLWKRCDSDKKDVVVTDTADTMVVADGATTDTLATADNTTTMTKVDEDIDLNGVALKGYKGGMEDSMITFLKSGNYKNAADDAALKDTWYTFDKVNFKIGSSTELEAGSQVQMDNLLAILKAYPEAKIKVGGYTDKTGDEAKNVSLSKARAEYIKKWLTDKGVGAQVLDAEGYGSKFATVDAAATNDERAVDRKMAVRFAK